MEKKYSKRLRSFRVVGNEKSYLLNDGSEEKPYLPDDVVVEWIKDFCNIEDLVGVSPREAWQVFREFLYENDLYDIYENRFTKLVRVAFPELKRKRVRLGKHNLVWVYTIGGNAGK